MQIDMAQFVAAIVDQQGGEVRISYDAFKNQTGDRALTIDFEEDGAVMVLRLIGVEDIPEDVE